MNCLQNSEEYNHELKYIITLDGGTTNTRAYLWRQDGSFVSSKNIIALVLVSVGIGVVNAKHGEQHYL